MADEKKTRPVTNETNTPRHKLIAMGQTPKEPPKDKAPA